MTDNLFDPARIHIVGICGAGQMGTTSAVAFQRAGYHVLLWDHDAQRLTQAQQTCAALDEWLCQHVGPVLHAGGTLTLAAHAHQIDERADLILDCINEDLQQKVELFKPMRQAVARSAIFITTTSGLSITELGRQSDTATLLAGAHFWNPAHLMPLVEVIRGQETPDGVMDCVCAIVASIGKIPVRVEKDVPGFIGNRLLHALWREALALVERGIASPQDIDRVARLTFGLRMPVLGPFENMDLVGLDLVQRIHEYLLVDLADADAPQASLVERIKHNALGMKSGQGFYDWSQRNGQTLIEQRNRQIVQQLHFLKELDAL
jgi:3-hydroxybutyryl-CoA dehydrogenase